MIMSHTSPPPRKGAAVPQFPRAARRAPAWLGLRAALLCTLFCTLLCTGCADEEAWAPGKPLAKEKIVLGVLYLDKADSAGYSFAHETGIRKMQQALGLRDDQIIRKFDISESDARMIEHTVRECIAAGANIIIATSWGYMDACEALADEYPGVIFANATGYKRNGKNFTNYFGRIYQARYLSGIVAGLKTKTGKIGFVAAMGSTNTEVTSGINAFALGVESVNPDARIYVRVTNSWFDPAGERRATQHLLGAGCDVIAQHCDTVNPQINAEKAGAWGIGYNSDMARFAPNAVLTSVVWNWDVYYTHLVASVINGSFTTKPYYGGMAEGMVAITPLNENLTTPAMKDAVTAAQAQIIAGKNNVFDGVMRTNSGRTVGTQGGTLPDSEITGGINWYYRTVVDVFTSH